MLLSNFIIKPPYFCRIALFNKFEKILLPYYRELVALFATPSRSSGAPIEIAAPNNGSQ
jgi:hypothetical protein